MIKLSGKSVKPGDVFYIPALNQSQEQGFVMARFIENVPVNVGYLLEVFSRFYTIPPACMEDIDMSQRLFRPVMTSFSFSEVPKWRVLFSDPDYDRSQSRYDEITFSFVRYLWVGGKEVPKSEWDQDISRIERPICWRTLHLILRVNAHLAGIFKADEPRDYHRLPENMKEDNPEALATVIALAEAMDDKFKLWAVQAKKKKRVDGGGGGSSICCGIASE